MTIGSILGNSFGNVLFGVSVLMLEYYYYEVFLIKYNFGVFDEMSIMEFLIKCQLWS